MSEFHQKRCNLYSFIQYCKVPYSLGVTVHSSLSLKFEMFQKSGRLKIPPRGCFCDPQMIIDHLSIRGGREGAQNWQEITVCACAVLWLPLSGAERICSCGIHATSINIFCSVLLQKRRSVQLELAPEIDAICRQFIVNAALC